MDETTDNVIDITPVDDKQEEKGNIIQAKTELTGKAKGYANLIPGGNPSGRPKVPDKFKQLVAQNTVPALLTVLYIMQDDKAKNSDRLKAAELILERAYGKAVQPIIGDINTASLVVKLEGQLADWAK